MVVIVVARCCAEWWVQRAAYIVGSIHFAALLNFDEYGYCWYSGAGLLVLFGSPGWDYEGSSG